MTPWTDLSAAQTRLVKTMTATMSSGSEAERDDADSAPSHPHTLGEILRPMEVAIAFARRSRWALARTLV